MKKQEPRNREWSSVAIFFLLIIALGVLIGIGLLLIRYIESSIGPSMNSLY